MMPGHGGMSLIFGVLHLGVISVFFYFLYHISKSLKRIANHFDNK